MREVRDGLGGLSGRVQRGERLVATSRGTDVLGVISVAELEAARPEARMRARLPGLEHSAHSSGAEQITTSELRGDVSRVLRRVAEDGVRYVVTSSGDPVLAVVSERDFDTYLGIGRPRPTPLAIRSVVHSSGTVSEGLARGERYLVTGDVFRAVFVSVADLEHITTMERLASNLLTMPAGAGAAVPFTGLDSSGVVPAGAGSALFGFGQGFDSFAGPGSAGPRMTGPDVFSQPWSGLGALDSGLALGTGSGGFFTGPVPVSSPAVNWPPPLATSFSSPSRAAGVTPAPVGGLASTPGRFYEETIQVVRARWVEVRQRVGGGDRIVVSVLGRPGLALVPLADLGAVSAHLPRISMNEVRDGLGGLSGRVQRGERLVATLRGTDVLGVISVAELEAARPEARMRARLPGLEHSAHSSGAEQITWNELRGDVSRVLRRVAEDGVRYVVTSSGDPVLAVVSERDFDTYLGIGRPRPTPFTAQNARNHLGTIYNGVNAGERYLVTGDVFRAVVVSVADLESVLDLESEWASLVSPASGAAGGSLFGPGPGVDSLVRPGSAALQMMGASSGSVFPALSGLGLGFGDPVPAPASAAGTSGFFTGPASAAAPALNWAQFDSAPLFPAFASGGLTDGPWTGLWDSFSAVAGASAGAGTAGGFSTQVPSSRPSSAFARQGTFTPRSFFQGFGGLPGGGRESERPGGVSEVVAAGGGQPPRHDAAASGGVPRRSFAGDAVGIPMVDAHVGRRWEKLPSGERLDEALWRARRLVEARGVRVPISLDGNQPFDRVSRVERLVRGVAVHLFHGEAESAGRLLARVTVQERENHTPVEAPEKRSRSEGHGAGESRTWPGAEARQGEWRELSGGAQGASSGAAGPDPAPALGGGQSPTTGLFGESGGGLDGARAERGGGGLWGGASYASWAGSVDWAGLGNEPARVAWERAQSIMGGGNPGWQSARADQLPPEGQLLRQIALDLYHAADDTKLRSVQQAQRQIASEPDPPKPEQGEFAPWKWPAFQWKQQRASELRQMELDLQQAIEDRVNKVAKRWEKFIDRLQSPPTGTARTLRPVMGGPQTGSGGSQPGASAWRFGQRSGSQDAAAVSSSGAGAVAGKWFYDEASGRFRYGDGPGPAMQGAGSPVTGGNLWGGSSSASNSSGSPGSGLFRGLPGRGAPAVGPVPARLEPAGRPGAGVEAGPDGNWARRWDKLTEGARRDQAVHDARELVEEHGVHVPISLDGLDPYERVPAVERLVRRVAVLLYHGDVTAARHEAAQSAPQVLAEPHSAFSRTAYPPQRRTSASVKTTSAREHVSEAHGTLPGAGFHAAGPKHGHRPASGTSSVDRWFSQAAEALEERTTDSPFWRLWAPTDVGTQGGVHIFGAENRELRLRGRSEEYPVQDPLSTVRWFTDRLGRWISNGPRWSWYTDGGTLLAVSDLRLASLPEAHTSGSASPLPLLATSATMVGNAPVDFFAGMRWRQDGKPLYWFTDRPPQEVFRQGAVPKGSRFASLLEYVYHGREDTVWVSATRNSSLIVEGLERNPVRAGAAADRYRWRYELRVPGGVDVNATLDFASPYPFEREIAFPGGVHPRFLHSAVDLESSGAGGRPAAVMNPHFAPGSVSRDLLAAYGHVQRPTSGVQETVDLWHEPREGRQGSSDDFGFRAAEAELERSGRDAVTAADGLTTWQRQALSARAEGFVPRWGLLGGIPQLPPGFFFPQQHQSDRSPTPLIGNTGSIDGSIWGPSTAGSSSAWPTNSFASSAGPSSSIWGPSTAGSSSAWPTNSFASSAGPSSSIWGP
ncbi:type II toxin-antitoxin system prevent-host-death family antitoxin, partial [Streptomyces nigra]|uniref:type II toxin-antitoxin system prevent-host-death family antitoxin n=1 Tax=Streptomyces nigra TaxID=1827580 RepID=UPI0037D85A50